MKRKIAFLLALVLLVVQFTGCSKEGQSYFEKLEKINQWTATEQDMKMSFAVDVKTPDGQSEKVELAMTGKAFQTIPEKGKIKGEVLFDFDMKMGGSDANASVSVKNQKFVVTEEKIYMPVSFFNEVQKLSGQKPLDVKAKYIVMGIGPNALLNSGIPGADAEKLNAVPSAFMGMDYLKDPAKLTEKFVKAGDILGVDFKIEQKGDVYTINVTGADLVKFIDSAVDSLPNKWIDLYNLFEIEKALKSIPEEQFATEGANDGKERKAEALKAIDPLQNKEKFTKIFTDLKTGYKSGTTRAEIEKALKGFNFKSVNEFKDNSVKSTGEFKLAFEGLFNISMQIESTAKKAQPKEIAVPNDKDTISFQKFLESMPKPKVVIIDSKSGTMVSSNQTQPVKLLNKDGKKLVEMRKVLTALGAEVGYDNDKKVPYVVIDSKKTELKLFVADGVSYIGMEDLKTLGFSVKVDQATETVVIQK